MRAAFDRYTAEGIITRDALQYARVNGYAPATIAKLEAVLLARVKASQARLALAGAPAMQKSLAAPTNPNDPTPEWQAKAGRRVTKIDAGAGEVTARKIFKIRSPIEQYRDKLHLTRRTALERFIQDAVYAQKLRVADLEPSGSGKGAGNRLGGLGNVQDYAREGFARYQWIYRHLGEEARWVAAALVTQEIKRGDGAPMTFEDAGKRLGPDIGHVHRLWGTSFGGLKVLAGQIVRLYELCPIGFRLVDAAEREFCAAFDAATED